MFKIKETFNDLAAWQQSGSLSVSDSEVTCTSGEAWLWQELPEVIQAGKHFRFDARVKFGGTNNDRVYFGLSSGTVGTHPTNHTRLSIGLRAATGCEWAYSGNSGIIGDGSTVTAGNYYLMSMVYDGETVTFALASDNDKTVVFAMRYNLLGNQSFNHVYIVFRTPNMAVERLGCINALDGYCDAEYNTTMRLGVFVGEHTNVERAYVEVPKIYNKSIKARLMLLGHGTGGGLLNFIGVGRNHYQSGMANKGYMTAVFVGGEHWGHWYAVSRGRQVRDRLYEIFNLYYKCFVGGASMGGYFACGFAKTYPHMVAGIALMCASTNLHWRYYGIYEIKGNTRATEINTAYTCTEETMFVATRGRSPHDYLDKLVQFPIVARHAQDDALVNYNHSVNLVNGVNSLGGNATLDVISSGGHAVPIRQNYEEDSAFFDQVTDLEKPQSVSAEIGVLRF